MVILLPCGPWTPEQTKHQSDAGCVQTSSFGTDGERPARFRNPPRAVIPRRDLRQRQKADRSPRSLFLFFRADADKRTDLCAAAKSYQSTRADGADALRNRNDVIDKRNVCAIYIPKLGFINSSALKFTFIDSRFIHGYLQRPLHAWGHRCSWCWPTWYIVLSSPPHVDYYKLFSFQCRYKINTAALKLKFYPKSFREVVQVIFPPQT